jgi:NitT/TauT family transport system ATP-binding protein
MMSYGEAATHSTPALEVLPGADPHIALSNVTLRYRTAASEVIALEDASLSVRRGEFVALVGPSGCGKSSILRLISGLLQPTSGTVRVGSKSEDLKIGMAFQNATLLPWLTILQNVMLPLKIVEPMRHEYRKKKRSEFRDRAEQLLQQVGLSKFEDKYPWQLSGGMLQRASLCRALIHNPGLLLLDEPFGALDQFTREELWAILQRLWMTHDTTIFMVTHDFREAVFLASRLCIMRSNPGRIAQEMVVPLARPRTLESTYQADFIELMHSARMYIDEGRIRNLDVP